MDKNIKNSSVAIDNLAIPEVRFGEEMLSNDAELEDMHVFTDNLAVPEVRVGKLAHEKNNEMLAKQAENLANDEVIGTCEATMDEMVNAGKKSHVASDNLAIPEVRFEEEIKEEVKPAGTHRKMHVDYSGAIPQITYTEE